MQANLINAAKHFFPNPSLEMVYFEAIANSIDANASEININISINSFTDIDSFKIKITDNGDGFNDENFRKFSILMENESDSHKGLGRLVYLSYFDKVNITSNFDGQVRSFTLCDSFNGTSELIKESSKKKSTTLDFFNYSKEKIKSYDYLKPESLIKSISEHFYPLFYTLKSQEKELVISISLDVKDPNPDQLFVSGKRQLKISELPELDLVEIEAEGLDLYENLQLHYSIRPTENIVKPITALCVDGRTISLDVLSKGGIPSGYEMIFLLYSNLFTGKVNPSRQELRMTESELKTTKKLFGKKIGELISDEIPVIKERNRNTIIELEDRFPHLTGLFIEESVGLLESNATLEEAQYQFFKSQKEILNSSQLTDQQFDQSLDISARILTEYILYRNILIDNMASLNAKDSEAKIHKLIVPMRKTLRSEEKISDVYNNNAWLLDDKFMSYTTILSDMDMKHLLKEISLDNEEFDNEETRPDISIVFSGNPQDTKIEKLDIVVVELKKIGLPLAKKEEVISQLKQRARKLLNYYPNRIQRIWFYGIVDFDEEFIRSLKEEEYLEVYSGGQYYYKELNIIPNAKKQDEKIPIGVNLISFESIVMDAKSRNSTFLELLKEGFKRD